MQFDLRLTCVRTKHPKLIVIMSHAHLHDKIAREILTSGEGGDFDLSNYDAESCETLVKEVREKN